MDQNVHRMKERLCDYNMSLIAVVPGGRSSKSLAFNRISTQSQPCEGHRIDDVSACIRPQDVVGDGFERFRVMVRRLRDRDLR